MQIPQSDILTTNRLGKIFSNTTATYKFFWFVSIMQIHAKSDNPRFNRRKFQFEIENGEVLRLKLYEHLKL